MAEIINLGAVRQVGRTQPPTYTPLCAGVDSEAGVSRAMSKADRALARLNKEKIPGERDEHRIETGEADEIAGR